MTSWEHAVVVLKISQKGFAVSRKDLLQGLEESSIGELREKGENGWELVSVVPISTASVGMFSNSKASTDSLLAFLKIQRI